MASELPIYHSKKLGCLYRCLNLTPTEGVKHNRGLDEIF